MVLKDFFFHVFFKSLIFFNKKIGQIDPGVAILLIIPILLMVANESWTFNAVSHIDPWIYLGFFLRLKQYLITFDGTYYATRLSWLLPGHLAYSIFPPLIANAILDFGTFYISVLSLYFTLKLTVDKRSAFFAAALLSLHPLFLGNIGWDYVSGIGISYFLLSIFLLTRAVLSGHNWLVLVFSGVTIGLTIYTNSFWIAFVPSLVIYYFSIRRKKRIKQFLLDILMLLIGLVLITLALGAVNYWANGNFWFFMPSLNYVSNAIDKPNPWDERWAKVLPNAGWLMTIGFTVFSSFLILIFRRKEFFRSVLKPPLALNFQLLLLFNFLVLVLFEIKGQPVLQFNYYASYLIPSVFLALGGQSSLLVSSLNRKQFLMFFCAFLVLAVIEVSYQVSNTFWRAFLSQFSLLHFFSICIILLCLWCYFASRNFKQNTVNFSLSGLTLIALMAILARPSTINYYELSRCPVRCGSTLEAVVQVHHFMEQYDQKVQALFWYDVYEDKLEPNRSAFYTGVSSTFLWGYRLLGEHFPQVIANTVDSNGDVTKQPSADEIAAKRALLRQTLINHQKVAILSRQPNALSQGIEALRGLNLGARLIAEKTIQAEDLEFNLIVLSIAEKPEPKANSSVQ